jgi:hypothetical protein
MSDTVDTPTTDDDGRTLRPLGWTGPTGARVTAHLHVSVALDNHLPVPRLRVHRVIEQITWPEAENGWTGIELSIPGGLDDFRDGDRALWLLDDGSSLTAYVTVVYHPKRRYIGLKRMRPEAGTPCAGYGPRRAYHVLVTRTDTYEEV